MVSLSSQPNLTRYTNALATGLLEGGLLSKNGVDKVDISAGIGIIVNNYTDVDNPTEKTIEWIIFTAVTPANLATEDETYFGIDINLNIVKQNTPFTAIQRRDIVCFGVAEHPDHANIESVYPDTIVAYDNKEQFGDFIESFGAWNVDGNDYYANGNNLKINKTAGMAFKPAVGYADDRRHPNMRMNNAETAPNFIYSNRDGSGGWDHSTATDIIDPDHWDNAGVVDDVTPGEFTIQTIFFEPHAGGIAVIQYGQETYATLSDALASIYMPIDLDPYVEEALFRCWLIVMGGTIDLSDTDEAKFAAAGRFGMTTIQSAAASGEANTASNVGLAGVGPFDVKVGVDLEFKNIAPVSTKITVVDNVPQKTIDIDVDPSKIPITGLFSTASPGQMLKADATGCPVNATNTDAQVSGHISSTSNPHSTTAAQVGAPALVNPAVVNNLPAFSSVGGLQKDSGLLTSDVSSAVSLKHVRQHALDATADHTIGGLTTGYLTKSDGSKLVPSTNTDAQIAAAVTAINAHKEQTINLNQGSSSMGTGTNYIQANNTNSNEDQAQYPSVLPTGTTSITLVVKITTNTRTSATTFTVRVNGVATAVTISVGAGATGTFTFTGSVAVTQGDGISLVAVASAGSGSLSRSCSCIRLSQ